MSMQFLPDFDASERHNDSVWAVRWAERAVLSASAAGDLRLWDPATGRQIGNPLNRAHTLGITSLSLDSSEKRALTNSVDGAVALWDLDAALGATSADDASAESQLLLEKKESLAGVKFPRAEAEGTKRTDAWATSLHPSGSLFAATGIGAGVSLYRIEPFAQGVTRIEARGKFGMTLAFSPDGRMVATGSDAGQVFLFDVESGQLVGTLSDHALPVRALEFTSPTGVGSSHLLVGSDDRTITLHDVRGGPRAGGGVVASLTGHKGWILSVAASRDGRVVASGSSDKTVKLWDLAASPKTCVSTSSESSDIWSVAWRPATATATGAGSANAFVTGGESGRPRFYRSAGAAPAA